MKRIALLVALIATPCIFSVAQVADFPDTNFSKADSIADLYAAHSLEDLAQLADKLTVPLSSEPEKFRAIFKWVCSNLEVDYDLVTLNKRKRGKLTGQRLAAWDQKFRRIVFERLVSDRKTLCTGYAYTIRELCFHAGLACKIVNGHANPRGVTSDQPQPINHSWNKVQLNGKWYVCDATWSSGIFNRTSGQFRKRYTDKYFLPDPFLFANDHAPTF